MNVHVTNAISKQVLTAGFEAGALAWAAVVVHSPIGALGGALFGGVRSITLIPLATLSVKCLNLTDDQVHGAALTLAAAIIFFGSYAIAWAAVAAAGFSLTLSHVVVLSIVSWMTAITLNTLLSCVGINVFEIDRPIARPHPRMEYQPEGQP